MSGLPVESLGMKTVTEYADTSNFDKLAAEGKCGFIRTAPEGMYPGSDTCNLTIMGYNPRKYYTGRSPLEAGAINVELGENDLAVRCNLVTLTAEGKVMEDFSAHHISNDDSKRAVNALNELFNPRGVEFYHGVGYRHIMVLRDVKYNLKTTAPHDIMGQEIEKHLPTGVGSDELRMIMGLASEIFEKDTFGKANAIWLWGEGTKPAMPLFEEMYGCRGAVIAAVDLIKGIGKFAGMDIINVPGATGFIDTNFKGKAEYAVEALKDHDYVFVHVEAADEAGHMGSIDEKKKAIENINNLMLPTIIEGLKGYGEYRLLITPDHPTPVELRTHINDPVPALIWGTGVSADENKEYNENIRPSFMFDDGYKIADFFIKSETI